MSGRIAVRWTTSARYVREVPRPDVDVDAARMELCRRHVRAFGPVDLRGRRARILAADEDAVRSAEAMSGVRLMVTNDLRLFGQDRTGLFAGPGLAEHDPAQDAFHPNGLVVDGRVVGAWGRRGGGVEIRVAGALPSAVRDAVAAEALSLPIPGAEMSVRFTEA